MSHSHEPQPEQAEQERLSDRSINPNNTPFDLSSPSSPSPSPGPPNSPLPSDILPPSADESGNSNNNNNINSDAGNPTHQPPPTGLHPDKPSQSQSPSSSLTPPSSFLSPPPSNSAPPSSHSANNKPINNPTNDPDPLSPSSPSVPINNQPDPSDQSNSIPHKPPADTGPSHPSTVDPIPVSVTNSNKNNNNSNDPSKPLGDNSSSAPINSASQPAQAPPTLSSSSPSYPAYTQAAYPTQKQPDHSHNNNNNNNNDQDTGPSVGKIMGILLASVVGALALAGLFAMLKRKRRARRQNDGIEDFFNNQNNNNEKSDYNDDSMRKRSRPSSQDGAHQTVNNFGPRPPSIIERHQASTALPGASYYPAYPSNYSNPQPAPSFNHYRPKPPTYNPVDFANEPSSGLPYANIPSPQPTFNSAPSQYNSAPSPYNSAASPYNSAASPYNSSAFSHAMSIRSAPKNQFEGDGNNIPMKNLASHSPPSGLVSPPTAHESNRSVPSIQHSAPSPNYSNTHDPNVYQKQVDQLDFFGLPSPASTMVNTAQESNLSVHPHDSNKQGESPLPTDQQAVDAGLALTVDRAYMPRISNLQQSYLDCESRVSESMSFDHCQTGHHDEPQQSQPNGLDPQAQRGLWDHKLSSPHISASLEQMFADGIADHDFHYDHAFDPLEERSVKHLRVTNGSDRGSFQG